MVTLILKKIFLENLDDKKNLCILNYEFFLVSPFFSENNNLKDHIT
jgi:hypothetical protein